MQSSEWATRFQELINMPPKAGDILQAEEGDARLDTELTEGKPPFMFSRVFVPANVGGNLGWFLQPYTSEALYGWKCIVLPKSREECLRRLGVGTHRIKSLRVVRPSQSGQALLCEIHEYVQDA